MSSESWTEGGLGPVQVRPWCAFTAQNITRGLPVQTQCRCSGKGSSVDSSLGWVGFAVSRTGSIV